MAAKTDLVIVESPSKAKTIGKYLGPGYEVKASMGHVRDLPKSKIGVDIEGGFVPQYQPIKGKEDVISDLNKAATKSGRVYLATDPDREGEAISWHLKELLDIPDEKTYRVTFNEITKKVVNDSIAAPRAIDQNLVDAQQARRILDRIVGYELSPLLWRKIRRGLSAGRVQSVATRLVAEREEEIRAFVPQEYWTIEAELERVRRSYPCIWKDLNAKPKLCFMGCPHMTLSQLKDWTVKVEQGLKAAGNQKVLIPTVFTSAPGVVKEFNRTEYAARLKATGVILSTICPLMYMNNPLSKKMPVITSSNKLRTYTSARFYSDEEILAKITKEGK